jgi:hypothetical protein
MLVDYIKEHDKQIVENKINIELKYKRRKDDEYIDNKQLLDKIESDIKDINDRFGKDNVNIKVCVLMEEL